MWNEPISKHSVTSSSCRSRFCSSYTRRIGWTGMPFRDAASEVNFFLSRVISVSNVCSEPLMTADDCLDFGIQERVENLVDLRARYTENVLDALGFQTFDQQSGAGLANA